MGPMREAMPAVIAAPSVAFLRRAAGWLLCLALAFVLTFAQSAEAAASVDHHADTAVGVSNPSADQTASAPSCHPGLACAAFVVPDGPASRFIFASVRTLRPELAEAQLRFRGPSVTLPPPRDLI